MGIARYVGRRALTSVVLLLVLSLVVFVGLQRLIPGNEASLLAGNNGATPKAVHAIEVRLGLTRPILDQYLTWLGHLLHANLGTSAVSGQKVTSVIGQQLPVSLELALLGVIVATLIGIPVGVIAGIFNGRKVDMALRAPFLVAYAAPFFVTGTLALLAVSQWLPGLYSPSYVSLGSSIGENLKVMWLPAVSVGIPVAGFLMQMTRATIAEILTQPYMTTARASGLPAWKLYGVYALKAAALPILSLEGFLFGFLIGGLIVAEQVFSLPGLGRGLLNSIQTRDYIELEAQVLVMAAIFIVGNLLADVLAPVFDRRITSA